MNEGRQELMTTRARSKRQAQDPRTTSRGFVGGPLGAVVLLLAGLPACTPMNESNGLIGAEPNALPDLDGHAPAIDAEARYADGTPTLQGLDRRHWPTVVLLMPSGQVEHQPYYFESLHLASGPARNEKLAPTTETVLEGSSDGGSLLLEAAAAPFVTAGELVILPVRAIIDPPWSVHRSPAALPEAASASAPVDWRWVERRP